MERPVAEDEDEATLVAGVTAKFVAERSKALDDVCAASAKHRQVEDRLGEKAGHGRGSDVLDGQRVGAERTTNRLRQTLRLLRPSGIARCELDVSVPQSEALGHLSRV